MWIDPNNFDKVLVNLLSNAFKYTPENGVICIEVKTGSNPKSSGLLQKYMEISISDTGKGVNEKELKKSSIVFIKAMVAILCTPWVSASD